MFSYAVKRVTRSLGLFGALLLGIILASTFFAGINVGADTTAKAALDQQLSRVSVDVIIRGGYRVPLSSANWTTASERVALVDNVVDNEIISTTGSYAETNETDFEAFTTVGIVDDSRVYSGLSVMSGASSLQENETYVWAGSEDADKLKINDTLTFNYTVRAFGDSPIEFFLPLQFKVVGFVSLDETALAISSGEYQRGDGIIIPPSPGVEATSWYSRNILITSWEKTFAKLIDEIYFSDVTYTPFNTEILGFIDREAVINPWDIGASQETINRLILQINNNVAEFDLSAYSNLQMTLNSYQFLSLALRLTFLVVALPVFFVAWYVGSTVSDVSFNLRRREIGLLSAKGFSSGQLLRLFLTESLLIGIIGGLIGVGLSFILSPYFIPSLGTEFGGTFPVLTIELILLAIVFSTGITLLSTFNPSRRAAKLPVMEALKEHLYVEETKPYKQKLPLMALFLGSYKIVMTLVGIPSLAQYFAGRPPPTTNIFLIILFAVWIVIDTILTPIGPLLFFWGFTKTLIRGSQGFQKLLKGAAKFLGDIGTLATKNMKRNPVRAASVAFLVALIIGYGFQTVGTLASEEDYANRQVKANVGADISVSLDALGNATAVMNNITELQGIKSSTLEYSFPARASSLSLSLIAVEPQEWLSTAYYENEWFSGQSVTTAFQELATDNNTIILERSIAKNLDLEINDLITVTINFTTTKLRVVGFFGPREGVGSNFWSYISHNFYRAIASDGEASERILVKLEPHANGTRLATQILALNSKDIAEVYSVSEQLEQRETNLFLSGTINVQRIGVIFAVVAASVATSLVALVSLQERKKEVAIMNIRGLSFKQLVTMLLAENLSIVVFATIIGGVVGMIIVHGNTVALNTNQFTSLVSHRLVFPPDAILTLLVSVILVFSSTLLPVIIITRKYISKLERIVRT